MGTHTSMFTSMEDRALLDAAKHLVIEEHLATAALLRALMEIDARRLYLGEGCASMFSYCTQVLHLAEGAAYNRIEAARAARGYPLILGLFEQGTITLTAVRLLAPHLTAENHHVEPYAVGGAATERTSSCAAVYADIGISGIMPTGGLCRVDIGSTRKHERLTDSRLYRVGIIQYMRACPSEGECLRRRQHGKVEDWDSWSPCRGSTSGLCRAGGPRLHTTLDSEFGAAARAFEPVARRSPAGGRRSDARDD